jgi:hypothetical protein
MKFFTVPLLESFAIYSFKDLIELALFCSGSVFLMNWLLQDRSQGLYRLFVWYSIFLSTALFFEFQAAVAIALYASPAYILLAIMLHEQTLQKKLITVKKVDYTQVISPVTLVDDLVNACLHARAIGKAINLLIEHHDDISTLINAEIEIDSALRQPLLNMVLDSSSYQDQKMIVVSTAGLLIGVNCSLVRDKHPHQGRANYAEITVNTDALLVTCDPASVGFMVYVKNSLLEKMSAKQLHTFLKHQLFTSISSSKGEERGQSYSQSPQNYQQPHR